MSRCSRSRSCVHVSAAHLWRTSHAGLADAAPQDAIVDNVCQGGSLAMALQGSSPADAAVLVGGLPGEQWLWMLS